MQLTPYAELIGLTDEERAKKSAPTKINTQKRRGELKIAELEEKIVSLEESVLKACSSDQLNYDAIVDAQDELALAIRRRDQFKDVLTQLFPVKV